MKSKIKTAAKKVAKSVKYVAKTAKKNASQRVSNAAANRKVKKLDKLADQAVKHSQSTRRERANPSQYKAMQISINKTQTKKIADKANKLYKGKKK